MVKHLSLVALGLVLLCPVGAANADPWKDESGQGRWHEGYSRDDDDWRRKGYARREEDWRRDGYDRDDDDWGRKGYSRRDDDRGYDLDDDDWRGRRYGRDEDWKRKGRDAYGRGRCRVERRWDGDEYLEMKHCKRSGDFDYDRTYH